MSRAVNLAALLLASSAGPVFAQSHADHAAHMGHDTATPQSECEAEAARHRAMGHAVPEDSCAPESAAPVDHVGMDHGSMGHGQMDHATMDHSGMDHSGMDHSGMDHSDMDHSGMNHGSDSNQSPEIPIAPPPASAGSGPPTAADAIWGADAMRASRAALARENGGMLTAGLVLDRFEYRAREGEDGYLWDGDA